MRRWEEWILKDQFRLNTIDTIVAVIYSSPSNWVLKWSHNDVGNKIYSPPFGFFLLFCFPKRSFPTGHTDLDKRPQNEPSIIAKWDFFKLTFVVWAP